MKDDDVLDLGAAVLGDQPEELTGRERRLSVRAYNYWASLLAGRAYPSVADLHATDIEAFRDTSILLDFSKDTNNPVLRYVGKSLREECGLSLSALRPEDVPGRSLLSRLTDHYLEILANRAPIGFEAEFHNLRGTLSMYRGILLPLSDDGETINFIYGVISWKEVIPASQALSLAPVEDDTLDLSALEDSEEHAEEAPSAETVAEPAEDTLELQEEDAEPLELGEEDAEPLELGEQDVEPLELGEQDSEPLELTVPEHGAEADPDAVAALADLLSEARDAAEAAIANEGRSRSTLYDALGRAYAFSHAAQADAAAYAEVLADAGIAAQERAPFTPIVKLVFGASYDKTRLTEYAAALSYATREGIAETAFRSFLDRADGGLKAIVQAERDARAAARGNQRIDKAVLVRDRLRTAASLATLDMPGAARSGEEFVLLVGRRAPGSDRIEIVAVADEKKALVDGVLRRLPKR